MKWWISVDFQKAVMNEMIVVDDRCSMLSVDVLRSTLSPGGLVRTHREGATCTPPISYLRFGWRSITPKCYAISVSAGT
jgi:hypothetical protein